VVSRIHYILLLPGKILSDASNFSDFEGDPLSPPEGEAAQGVRPPLDPSEN